MSRYSTARADVGRAPTGQYLLGHIGSLVWGFTGDRLVLFHVSAKVLR